jgi:Flp pilus assembly protein TadG
MKKRILAERGTSLVETALVFPVILILFMGVVEVGFLLFSHVQVANAAREGGRKASLCRMNWDCDDLTNVVKATVFSEARYLDMTDAGSGGNTTVVVQPPSLADIPAVGTPFTVTVTYNHSSPFLSNYVPMFPAEIPVQHTIIMHFGK